MMYDRAQTEGSYSTGTSNINTMNGSMPTDAIDLTDVHTASGYEESKPNPTTRTDYESGSSNNVQSHSSSGSSFVDLTHYLEGSYQTPDDYTRSSLSSALHTPVSALFTPQRQQLDEYPERDLVSPTPPTPFPKFQVFDLTCFIDDQAPSAAATNSSWKVSTPTQSWRSQSATNPDSRNPSTTRMVTPQPSYYTLSQPSWNTAQTPKTQSYHWRAQSQPKKTASMEPSPPDPTGMLSPATYPNYTHTHTQAMQTWKTPTRPSYQSRRESELVLPEPTRSPQSPPANYTLATPSQEFHNVPATDYCHAADDCHSEAINTAVQLAETRESEVVVHPPHAVLANALMDEEQQEEHSTIDVTDFSSGVPSAIDMFATDCKSCDESHIFDSLCRGMQPADTGTVAPSVTKLDRQEIRSCGTLPPERPIKNKKTGSKLRSKSCGNKKDKSRRETKRTKSFHETINTRPTSSKNRAFHELPAVSSEEHQPTRGRRRRTIADVDNTCDAPSVDTNIIMQYQDANSSQTSVGADPFLLRNDTKYRDKNCSQTSMGGLSNKSEDTPTTVDSIVDDVLDRREWMGNFVRDLFDQDQTKAVFYASSIAEKNMMKDNKGKGTAASSRSSSIHQITGTKKPNQSSGDFEKVRDYCNFVLQNLDLVDVLENIDNGVYDDHLDDFQEDIELCLEAAMDKHETFLQYENRKWKSKLKNDQESIATRKRHENLRLLAGEELMKQLDADFRMQLLEHFCQQISKRQNISKSLHKRQPKVRQ